MNYYSPSAIHSIYHSVLLGDGNTIIPIEGIDTIDYIGDSYCIILCYIYYVPGLQDTLFSRKEYMEYMDCTFHVEKNVAILEYPKFSLTTGTSDEVQVSLEQTL